MKKCKKIVVAAIAAAMCVSYTGMGNISGNDSYNETVIAADVEDAVWDGTIDTSWYDGEEAELYISTAEELAGLATIVNKGNRMAGQTIILGSDIYLNSLVDMNQSSGEKLTWTPIGYESSPFKANFNGNGHTIHGMNGTYLFGYVENSKISDITINKGYSGSICGKSINTTFENCVNNNSFQDSFSGEISDVTYSCGGGICGWAKNGVFKNCKNTGDVTANGSRVCIGGICGYNENDYNYEGLFENCVNDGNISGDNYCAGILANGDSDNIFNNCINNGMIGGETKETYSSGISNDGVINDCINNGDIFGLNSCGISYRGKVTRCCNKGDIMWIVIKYTDKYGNTKYEYGRVKGIGGYQAEYCSNYGNITYYSEDNSVSSLDVYGIGATTNICCYNRGNINAGEKGTAIGIGESASNCYNAGDMTGKYLYAISDTEYANRISDCYFINTAAPTGTGCNQDVAIAKSAANMKKESFVRSLGSAYVYQENDFPVLFWEAGIPLLTIDNTELTFSEYEQTQTITAETTSENPITWSSDNEKIATIDENGVITATGNGTCNIIAEVEGAKAYCSVTVAYDYCIRPTELSMEVDAANSLKIYSKNTNEITELPVSYSSSNEDVAEVNKRGIVSANSPGTAEIHAVIGDIDMVCVVTVEGVKGDVNVDGEFTAADVVALQKWLLAFPDTKLNNWKAADLCPDDTLNIFDLVLMKKELLNIENQ